MDNLGAHLKNYRIKSGLTVRELARLAKVSPSFVSQIENGKSQPSVATLYAFSQLLKVSVDELFDGRSTDGAVEASGMAGAVGYDDAAARNGGAVSGNGSVGLPGHGSEVDASRGAAHPDSLVIGQASHDPASAWHPSEYANRVSIVHPTHRSRIDMAAGVVWERLAATPEHGVNFMQIVYAPGASSTDSGEMSAHIGYEYGYVESGELEVTIGDEVFTLRSGESLGFDSSIPHTFRNPGTEVMHGVWFVHGS